VLILDIINLKSKIMSLSNASEYNAIGSGIGGGFGGLGGGIGTFGLLGLLGIGDITGRKKDDDCQGQAVLLAAIGNSKDVSVAEARAIQMQVCDAEKTNLQQFYAAAIQASNNTHAIKDQATALAIVADRRFDELEAASVAQTAAILAKINQTEIDALRDQLHTAHRHADKSDITITVSQAQAQAQQQQILDRAALDRRFDFLSNQINKTSNDVINFGTMAASGNQANQQTNVK